MAVASGEEDAERGESAGGIRNFHVGPQVARRTAGGTLRILYGI